MELMHLSSSAAPHSGDLASGNDTPATLLKWIEVTLLTGGFDRPYAFGLSMALVSNGVRLEVIGSDEVDSPEMHERHSLTFLNLHPTLRPSASVVHKIARILVFYVRLIKYATKAKPKVFHILWNNKVPLFDRTLLMCIYKALGKRIALTAHNVNAGIRDGTDSPLNRLTLRVQYHMVDRIFVHTQKMRAELVKEFSVRPASVTVIPFGINNAVPRTGLTTADAKRRLGIAKDEKAILFFGNIRPYKGLEYLVDALDILSHTENREHRLIIAGEANRTARQYWAELQDKISRGMTRTRVVQKIKYVPDDETEVYFKAADLSVLPYTHVYQSGVLFLGYSFGLPAVATDVGSFAEDIIEGETGFLCKPRDAVDLGRAIKTYFASDLYKELEGRRNKIQQFAEERQSWDIVGRTTRGVYEELIAN